MLILLSPILGILTEKVQQILHPEYTPPQANVNLLVKSLLRGLQTSFYNLFLELSFTLPLLALGIVFGGLGIFVTPLILAIGWYFLGYANLDLQQEYFQKSFREARKTIWQHRGLALGNGCGFYLLLFIPVFGVLFAPALSVTAANLVADKSFTSK